MPVEEKVKQPNPVQDLTDSMALELERLRKKNPNHPVLKEIYADRFGIHAKRSFYRDFQGITPFDRLKNAYIYIQKEAK